MLVSPLPDLLTPVHRLGVYVPASNSIRNVPGRPDKPAARVLLLLVLFLVTSLVRTKDWGIGPVEKEGEWWPEQMLSIREAR